VWDEALESPELKAYNDYLRALAAGRARKTWRNPSGLPEPVDPVDPVDVEPAVRGSQPGSVH
jgi:hypothetical protein